MYSPLSILSSKVLFGGLERPRGEVRPFVKRFWVEAEGRWAAGKVWSVVYCGADWIGHMALKAECWDWLKLVFRWKLDSSGSGSDLIISSLEDNDARSDRVLSLLTLSRFGGRLSSECQFAVLVAGHPLQALSLVTRFGYSVVNAATFPGKACFRGFSSCPLDPLMGRFRAWRQSLSTPLSNADRLTLIYEMRSANVQKRLGCQPHYVGLNWWQHWPTYIVQ